MSVFGRCWLSGIRAAVANVPMSETDRARLQGALYGINIILSIIEGHTKIDRPLSREKPAA